MLCCSVCGDWYPHVGSDRLDICPPCAELNFAGAQPPRPDFAAVTREILEAYVHSPHPMTPRQMQALARLAAVWRRPDAEETPSTTPP